MVIYNLRCSGNQRFIDVLCFSCPRTIEIELARCLGASASALGDGHIETGQWFCVIFHAGTPIGLNPYALMRYMLLGIGKGVAINT